MQHILQVLLPLLVLESVLSYKTTHLRAQYLSLPSLVVQLMVKLLTLLLVQLVLLIPIRPLPFLLLRVAKLLILLLVQIVHLHLLAPLRVLVLLAPQLVQFPHLLLLVLVFVLLLAISPYLVLIPQALLVPQLQLMLKVPRQVQYLSLPLQELRFNLRALQLPQVQLPCLTSLLGILALLLQRLNLRNSKGQLCIITKLSFLFYMKQLSNLYQKGGDNINVRYFKNYTS